MSRPALTALVLTTLASVACGGGNEEPPAEPVVPEDLDYCAIARDWEPAWTAVEDEVLELINEERGRGATCGVDEELFEATEPLRSDPALRCAARIHADDMGAREFFSNLDPDGVDFYQRAELAGYEGTALSQGIGTAQADPERLVEALMNNSTLCRELMNPAADEIGVGWTDAYDSVYWALTLGQS